LQTSRSKITTNKKNTLPALLAAGILVTGGTFFAVPPTAAFADHEEEHEVEEQVLYEDEYDLDVEVFDENGREYFGDDDDRVYVDCTLDTTGDDGLQL
jgi:hypothetical protein